MQTRKKDFCRSSRRVKSSTGSTEPAPKNLDQEQSQAPSYPTTPPSALPSVPNHQLPIRAQPAKMLIQESYKDVPTEAGGDMRTFPKSADEANCKQTNA